MSKVKSYLSLIKFSHTIFAMPFAMIGFFLGFFYVNYAVSVVPGWNTPIYPPAFRQRFNIPSSREEMLLRFGLVILCMVFARSSAMAFNRYLDRSFDAKNPRTAIREIPAGIIKANSVLLFTIANCLLFIVACFFINTLCFYLSPVALLVVLGYSYTKRFTPFCHLILGLGLSLAPIGAYLAVTGAFHWLPVLFSFAVIFWVSGFDIIYALQDEEFDRSQQLYSIPAWLGKAKALRVSELLHLFSAAAVTTAGIYGHFGWLYWIGVGVFIGMLIYQHSIVKPNDLKKVNLAFMTANGIASVVFAIFVIADLFFIFNSNYLPRIIAIDYGLKRTGLAVTDPLQIIATGLTTVESKQLIPFLKDYFSKEQVELIVIGEPKNMDDSDTHATPLVERCIKELQKNFPGIPIKKIDERFTSKMASQAMIDMGMKKKQRRDKALIDEIAATIILQDYLKTSDF